MQAKHKIHGTYITYFTKKRLMSFRGSNGSGKDYTGTTYRVINKRYTGIVWCPKLPQGTWVARRDGRSFITGNTFPRDIPMIALQAGTSEHGCCPECGAAYTRMLTKDEADEEWKSACGAGADGEYYGEALKEYEEHGCQDPSDVKRRILEGMRMIKTIGWQPTCACGRKEIIPCTVLDIFVGSGTTSEVAKDTNRNSIGIDLDPNNIPIQKKRMGFIDGQNRLVEDCEWIIL
jgi:hypothetical protein